MLKVLALVAFGYLLGSVPSGWLVMKVYRNQDVRQLGSGNIGAANVYRAGGPGAFATTLIADGLKGVIPVLAGILAGVGASEITLPLIGLAAVVGHTWSIYLGFRGGKGVATSGGVMLVLAPVALILSALAWFFVIRLTRLASLRIAGRRVGRLRQPGGAPPDRLASLAPGRVVDHPPRDRAGRARLLPPPEQHRPARIRS